MAFKIGKIFWILVNPGALLVLLILVSTLLVWTNRIRLARVLLTLCALFLFSLSLLNLHGHLTRPLENRFPLLRDVPANVDGIIVLGGIIKYKISSSRHQTNLNEAAERLTAAITLARQHPEATLLFSGGSNAILGGGSEADWVQRFFEEQGLPPDRMIFERSSRNTYENGINSMKLVPNAKEETWLLVTSATHMPRAMGVFQKLGWPVTPYPVDYSTGPGAFFSFSPLQRSLPEFSLAMKEWVGLLYYRMMGYSDEIYPGPRINI